MDITQLRNGCLKMSRIRFKAFLYLSLIMIPISTQTGSDLILSDNWAIKRRIQWLESRLTYVNDEIRYYESRIAIQLAEMEIRRHGEF